MLCIDSKVTDPYFNLAAEEFLLKTRDDDVFMLWQSDPVVVSGKHQNTISEINYRYVREMNISVARRLTGGGTVYHDEGNINFTFIRHGEPGKLVDFTAFIEPVIRFLGGYQIDSQQGSKHEILVQGKKISGNAEHVYKNRVLHHGTLLFDADMNRLHQSIKSTPGRYIDKSVQSNRSNVINLSECIESVSRSDFRNSLFSFILDFFQGESYEMNESERMAVNKLAVEKYRTWEWIYGWSPDYTFRNAWYAGPEEIKIDFSVHRGVITESRICSTLKGLDVINLNSRLKGILHRESEILTALSEAGLNRILNDDGQFSDLLLSFF